MCSRDTGILNHECPLSECDVIEERNTLKAAGANQAFSSINFLKVRMEGITS
jgi:hypothetical protein